MLIAKHFLFININSKFNGILCITQKLLNFTKEQFFQLLQYWDEDFNLKYFLFFVICSRKLFEARFIQTTSLILINLIEIKKYINEVIK